MKPLLLTSLILFLIIISFFSYIAFAQNSIKKSITTNDGDYVVLVHGLGRSSKSMMLLGRTLQKNGYQIINVDYPSTQDTIKNLVDNHLKKQIKPALNDKTKNIHFVTHSMGGIIVRYYLEHNEVPNAQKVIMIAPPNNGSKSADNWSNYSISRYVMGPALQELKTDKTSTVNKLPLPDYNVGVIAGKYDHKVPPTSAKLSDNSNFIIVPSAHTFIMNSRTVKKQILYFLKQGSFRED